MSEEKIKKTAEPSETAQILARMADMEEARKADAAKIAMLTAVADKGQLAKWEAKQDKKIVRQVGLRYHHDSLVLSWRKIEDRVWKDNDDNWHERQVYELETEDGEKTVIDIRQFGDLEKRLAKVLKREQHFEEDKNGVEVLTEEFLLAVPGHDEPMKFKGCFVN